jgi:hypothetical protein
MAALQAIDEVERVVKGYFYTPLEGRALAQISRDLADLQIMISQRQRSIAQADMICSPHPK